VAEQRYKAVLAVIADARTVVEVAAAWSVSRQTLHGWLSQYEHGGLQALADRSHRPETCPHQMDSQVEVAVLEMRRPHPGWAPGGSCSQWPRPTRRCRSPGCPALRALRALRTPPPHPTHRKGRPDHQTGAPSHTAP
jgi:hypothetical protein